MNPQVDRLSLETRRHFLQGCGLGLGSIGLSAMMARDLYGAGIDKGRLGGAELPSVDNPLAPRRPPLEPKAKRMIYLHMSGAPPHLDLFDYKPQLVKHDGEVCPDEFTKGRRFAFTTGTPKLLGTRRQFTQHGQGGVWMSDAISKLHEVADDLCVIKSMTTDQFNHAPAELLLFTGSARQGRPSMGSWVTYGLGSENENLPGFVVLISSGVQPSGGQGIWGSGFLPSVFQGVQCRSKGDPVLYVSNPDGMDRPMRRRSLDALNDLNAMQAAELGSPETQARIAQYELAYRMQTAVPEVMDIGREPKQVLEEYGAEPGGASFANNCLLARRLLEQGVRLVQLFDWGWDFHGTAADTTIVDGLTKKCATMDRPVAALLKDLKRRGMLDDTLVVWGGEFGRTPFREGRTAAGTMLGRDHYPDCFSIFMAGAGVKGGIEHGETDELGFSVARDKVHVHDLQATILHLLGFDHERLTTRYQGRDFRLTDVHGKVVHEILS